MPVHFDQSHMSKHIELTLHVLLYYKYVDLSRCRSEVAEWMSTLCGDLNLAGRVRVADDGINVVVGGTRQSCEKHIMAVCAHEVLQGADIDFKLSKSQGAANHTCREESGFTGLAVRQCQELVTLGERANGLADISNAGTKLSPEGFHAAITEFDPASTILMDVRNVYESDIGFFNVDGLQTLKPPTRCFSEWPAWLDQQLPHLAGKHVLMYCTGGVRCERASAYLRSKGLPYNNVEHLQGGIERYLEAFPQGGAFKGKNFVFDERVVHPNSVDSGETVGRCLNCDAPHDDYSHRHRCSHCRLLVLICRQCACSCVGTSEGREPEHDTDFTPETTGDLASGGVSVAGEPCSSEHHDVAHVGAVTNGSSHELLCRQCMAGRIKRQPSAVIPDRKLRILALHGFRENGNRLRGRLRGLMKRMRHLVDIDFVTAPHALPAATYGEASRLTTQKPISHGPCGPEKYEPGKAKPKCGWFVVPDEAGIFHDGDARLVNQVDKQTHGLRESLVTILQTVGRSAPYDGCLAFSQGCALAAALVALQELKQRNTKIEGHHSGILGSCLQDIVDVSNWNFSFVMLCSGHIGVCPEVRDIMNLASPLQTPSLHVFGAPGKDKQVEHDASLELFHLFCKGRAIVHNQGHIIPASRTDVRVYTDFIMQAVDSA